MNEPGDDGFFHSEKLGSASLTASILFVQYIIWFSSMDNLVKYTLLQATI